MISDNFDQLLNEPTHIPNDGSQSRIDLIFTDQPFFFTDSGVLPPLDTHSKHTIFPWYIKYQHTMSTFIQT